MNIPAKTTSNFFLNMQNTRYIRIIAYKYYLISCIIEKFII